MVASDCPILDREASGWPHAEAGGTIARSWKLPESFAELVNTHTENRALSPEKDPRLLDTSLSVHLPVVSDVIWHKKEFCERAYEENRPQGAVSLTEILE